MSTHNFNLSKIKLSITLIILSMILANSIFAQGFGKNKVQYREFDWKYMQSKHFDIYYYGNSKRLAEFVADEAESSYISLRKNLNYDIGKRIPIIVYNSHNDFAQTNVSQGIIDEGVGGFTEFLKDRVVIPFLGSYQDFRDVLHHELTHAVMLQMLYGSGTGSMITGMARFRVPLWIMEGMAEYQSLGWDIGSDMFMRDATLNNYVPPIPYISGYLNYKAGQSIFHFIAEKYGTQKLQEIISKIRLNRNIDKALKNSIGLDQEELSKRWQKYLQKTYWPDIENRDEPENFAKKLTDHVKHKHFLNNAPALSPQGDRLIYLTNQSDYMDINLMSTIDGRNLGRLVKGNRSELFEELHWTRPGMDWSPDGKRVVFAAKSGKLDALHILDVNKRKVVQTFHFDLDGVFSPSWSPDGDRIVFMGMKDGWSDLYLYSLKDDKLVPLTNDIFSDQDPIWSPQGDEIAFVSDRRDYAIQDDMTFRMQDYDYSQTDLYIINVSSKAITKYTSDAAHESSPAFSPDGNRIAYISDKSGITNIYMIDRSSNVSYPITNLVTGCSQLSWSREGSRMVFSSFFEGGYDLYLLNNPLDIEPGSVTVEKTDFLVNQEKEKKPGEKEPQQEQLVESETTTYRNYVFGPAFRQYKNGKGREKKIVAILDTTIYKNENGEYKEKSYKVRFSPDYVQSSTGYSQFYGLQGTTMIGFSDILGNHMLNVYADLFYDIKNSNFQLSYFYLPKRIDIGASIFHHSYLYYTYFTDGLYYWPGYFRDRNYGLTLYMSLPLDRYQRLEFALMGLAIDRTYGDIDPLVLYYGYPGDLMKDKGSLYKRRVLLFNLGYSSDTVLWGTTGPVNGSRSNITARFSPSTGDKYGLHFSTFRGDFRKYFRIKKDYNFSVRVAGGISMGRQPQKFLLGGMPNWINYKFSEIASSVWAKDYLFFSSFEAPLRGTRYYEMVGTRFFLTNLEFRFPLIRYLIMGWPLPLGFQNIRGVIFMDMGSAWSKEDAWKPFKSNKMGLGSFQLNDIQAGFGFGARLNFGFILLKYDAAWQTDIASTAPKPIHYFSLGAEF